MRGKVLCIHANSNSNSNSSFDFSSSFSTPMESKKQESQYKEITNFENSGLMSQLLNPIIISIASDFISFGFIEDDSEINLMIEPNVIGTPVHFNQSKLPIFPGNFFFIKCPIIFFSIFLSLSFCESNC